MDAATLGPILGAVCANWNHRARQLGLTNHKTKGYQLHQEAFVQGAITALLAAGVLDAEQYQRIGFMCSIGRLDEWVQARAVDAIDADRRAA